LRVALAITSANVRTEAIGSIGSICASSLRISGISSSGDPAARTVKAIDAKDACECGT
jgi:hypothetical protein